MQNWGLTLEFSLSKPSVKVDLYEKYVQSKTKALDYELFYDMKWGHFDRVNSTFKMLLSSWNFNTVFKKIRSFDAENLGSVG